MTKGFQKGHGNIGGGNKKGFIPWNKGKKEIRISVLKNQSDSHLGQVSSMGMLGKKHTPETIEKMKIEKTGEKNHKWISDRSQLAKKQERNDSAYQDWRMNVWKRDRFKCKISDKNCNGRLEAHHILPWRDFVELRYEINNGITLCHAHHPRKQAEEKRLSPYFAELVSVSNN